MRYSFFSKLQIHKFRFASYKKKLTFKDLTLLLLFFVFISANIAESTVNEISPNKWEIAAPDDVNSFKYKVKNNTVYYRNTIIISASKILPNLSYNKILSIRFPKIENVIRVKVYVLVSNKGKTGIVERTSTITPGDSEKTIRFDFSNENVWNGFIRKIKIKVTGLDVRLNLPTLKIYKPSFLTRLSIFFEKISSPTYFNALIVNLMFLPKLFGISLVLLFGLFWIVGLVIVILCCRLKNVPSLKNIAIWSLVIWVSLDVLLKLNFIPSVKRMNLMKNQQSDTIGTFHVELQKISKTLINNNIKQVGLLTNSIEKDYPPLVLLPTKINNNYRQEKVILVRAGKDRQLIDANLIFNGEVILKNIEILEKTDSFTLIKGTTI